MNATEFAEKFIKPVSLLDERLVLDVDGFRIAILTNSLVLLQRLSAYFEDFIGGNDADIEVVCIESLVVETGLTFTHWEREAGKTGRKDAFYDLKDGRLVYKVRTGMLFLQSQHYRIAVGPCCANDNQVINFINSQYMTKLQNDGALICHAAAVECRQAAIALAGFSGGGKSTLMLNMLAHEGVSFMSNDRLFLQQKDGYLVASGVPKLPRVNPGTLLNNPLLITMLSSERISALKQMSTEELWQLEEKYDIDIRAIYGKGKITGSHPLVILVILNWHYDDKNPCTIQRIDLNLRQDLLPAVMKSAGPFYQHRSGAFEQHQNIASQAKYLQVLEGIDVYEITGRVDFQRASDFFIELMHQKPVSRVM